MFGRDGGCILEAIRLKGRNNDRGGVYFVNQIEDVYIGHAYYVPDPTKTDSPALNQADNGFFLVPPLRVREVLEFGTRYG